MRGTGPGDPRRTWSAWSRAPRDSGGWLRRGRPARIPLRRSPTWRGRRRGRRRRVRRATPAAPRRNARPRPRTPRALRSYPVDPLPDEPGRSADRPILPVRPHEPRANHSRTSAPARTDPPRARRRWCCNRRTRARAWTRRCGDRALAEWRGGCRVRARTRPRPSRTGNASVRARRDPSC